MEATGLGTLKAKINALSHKVEVVIEHGVVIYISSCLPDTLKILGETCLTQTWHLELEARLCLAQTLLRIAVLPGEFSECLVAGKFELLQLHLF